MSHLHNLSVAGSLGFHHLCLQEECLQRGDWQVEELVQHNRQADVYEDKQ